MTAPSFLARDTNSLPGGQPPAVVGQPAGVPHLHRLLRPARRGDRPRERRRLGRVPSVKEGRDEPRQEW